MKEAIKEHIGKIIKDVRGSRNSWIKHIVINVLAIFYYAYVAYQEQIPFVAAFYASLAAMFAFLLFQSVQCWRKWNKLIKEWQKMK